MAKRKSKADSPNRCPVSGKVSFPTMAKARAALKQAKTLAGRAGPKTAYKCSDCPGYHLTGRRHMDLMKPRKRP